jgi:hypothetical protein
MGKNTLHWMQEIGTKDYRAKISLLNFICWSIFFIIFFVVFFSGAQPEVYPYRIIELSLC